MKPGESRVVRELPCPHHMLHHPNEYWMLRRASRRLYERTENFTPAAIRDLADAVEVLRNAADAMESRPCRVWTDHKLGTIYEICCPGCETLFEWTGKFYAPQCPSCKRWLRSEREREKRAELEKEREG